MNFFHRKGEVPFFTSLSSQSFANLFDRLFLVIVCLILLTFQSFAQSDDWTLSAEKDGVEIFYQKTECNNQPVTLIRIINSNADSVEVSWKAYATLESLSDELALSQNLVSVKVPSGLTEASDCSEMQNLQLTNYPNRIYFAQNLISSDSTEQMSVPKMAIVSFRLDEVGVTKNSNQE